MVRKIVVAVLAASLSLTCTPLAHAESPPDCDEPVVDLDDAWLCWYAWPWDFCAYTWVSGTWCMLSDIVQLVDKLDAAACPPLASLAPGFPGVIINSQGDVYVDFDADGIADPEELFWDCPPYVS